MATIVLDAEQTKEVLIGGTHQRYLKLLPNISTTDPLDNVATLAYARRGQTRQRTRSRTETYTR